MNPYSNKMYDKLNEIQREEEAKKKQRNQYRYKNHLYILMEFQLFMVQLESGTGMTRVELMDAVRNIMQVHSGVNEFDFNREYSARWDKGE